jgi:hypothetical protein
MGCIIGVGSGFGSHENYISWEVGCLNKFQLGRDIDFYIETNASLQNRLICKIMAVTCYKFNLSYLYHYFT